MVAETALRTGRDGLLIPDIHFSDTSDLHQVSQFFRMIWAANTSVGRQFDEAEAGPFDGTNYLKDAPDIAIRRSPRQPRALFRYSASIPAHAYEPRVETYTVIRPNPRTGAVYPYIVAAHRSAHGSRGAIGRDLVTATRARLGSASVSILDKTDELYEYTDTDRQQRALLAHIMRSTVEYLTED